MKIAIVLSGCGHRDGAEIREAVLGLLYLDQQGAEVEIFAPDAGQPAVIDHLTGKETEEKRNMLAEAARIARGRIRPLSQARAEAFDALILPGGFGAAKNLSDFATKGKDCTVLPELQRLIRGFYKQKKPIGAICIAPVVLAAALRGVTQGTYTVGDDQSVASAIEAMGGCHRDCPTDACVTDEQNLIVTCPAYMRDDRLSRVAQGIETLVAEVIRLAQAQKKEKAA